MAGTSAPRCLTLDLTFFRTCKTSPILHGIGDMRNTRDIVTMIKRWGVGILIRRFTGTETIDLSLIKAQVVGVAARNTEISVLARNQRMLTPIIACTAGIGRTCIM